MRPAQPTTQLLWFLLLVGLMLQVLGFLVTGLNVPHVEVSDESLVVQGDRGVVLMGLLAFGLGGVLSLVAVVGFGVLLGLRARAEDPAVRASMARDPAAPLNR